MSFIRHNEVRNSLAKAIAEVSELEIEAIYPQIVIPPNIEMGHLAFGCFVLAKKLKKSPAQIATQLSEQLNGKDTLFAKKWIAQGPYLNVFIDTAACSEKILSSIINEEFFETKLTQNPPKVMIEYSQPNTHKELHVGHMRNLCLGDAVVRLLRYSSHEVIASTFPGDVGTHVAKCLWYMKNHNQEQAPVKNKGAWLGSMYTKSNNLLEEQRGTDKEDSNREQLTKILHELHDGNGEYFDLWKETREWSIELMQSVYNWAGVTFDKWYWESEVDAQSVALVKKHYEEGLFVKDDGAIGIDLSDDKLGFCLLIKTDGTGLYATKDIELARRKFEDFKIQKNIYVVDKRQSHHFKQVFKTLEKMGFEHAKDCHHLQYDFVELPDGAMSSRKGNIVPLQELITQMEEEIKTQYLERYKDEWSSEEINHTAQIVASGAIKFGMNRIDPSKKIVFDMKEWLKIDGESGPYVQYVHARIQSMISKINSNIIKEDIVWSELVHQLETNLILKMADFNTEVESTTKTYKSSHLCSYLYDLAKMFNSFYAECSVGNAETKELQNARLALCQCVATTLKQGLSLLGITAPLKM